VTEAGITRSIASLEDDVNNKNFTDHDGAEDELYQESCFPSFTAKERIMGHSKVYTFANQFLCPKLKTLALHHLTIVLQSAKLKTNRFFPGLIDAARHIYSYTREQTLEPEPARALIMQFVVECLDDDLNHDLDILVSKESDFTRDLLRVIVKRATTAEQELATSLRESTEKDEKLQKLMDSRCKRCKISKHFSEKDTDAVNLW
jgi:hypothetical protein